MRCYLQAFLLCMVFSLFSLLYVFSQLASTLEDNDEWVLVEQRTTDRSSHEGGHRLRKKPGSVGPGDSEAALDR